MSASGGVLFTVTSNAVELVVDPLTVVPPPTPQWAPPLLATVLHTEDGAVVETEAGEAVELPGSPVLLLETGGQLMTESGDRLVLET